jgi:hypothetical protein
MQKRTRSASLPARPDAPSETPQGERQPRAAVVRKNTKDLRPGAMQIMLKILCKRATEAHATPKDELWKEMAAAFDILHPGHGVANVERTMFARLFEKVCEAGEICDRPKSGRPGLVTYEQVRVCNMHFKRGIGNKRADEWYGYTSFAHAARKCEVITKTIEECKIVPATLWRRMREVQQKECGRPFRKITIRVRPPLTRDILQERLAKAKEWCTWDEEYMKSIFWIDEKQEYLSNSSYECYADDDDSSYTVESHNALGKSAKIKYIACVNTFMGPVYFAIITGTTGYDSGYTVRTSLPPLRYSHPPAS